LEVCWLDKKADKGSLINHAEPLFNMQDMVSMDPVTPFQDDLLHSANEPQDHDVSGAVYELQDPNLTMSESDIYGLLSPDMTTLGQVPLASSSVIPGDQSAADLLQDASTISELT
jgi:hypothetical protein